MKNNNIYNLHNTWKLCNPCRTCLPVHNTVPSVQIRAKNNENLMSKAETIEISTKCECNFQAVWSNKPVFILF